MELEGTLVSVKEVLGYMAQDRYMGKRQAAAYTSLSIRTLEGRLDEIPHFRLNKKVLFKKSELDRWMEGYREGGSRNLDRVVDEALESIQG